MLQPVREVQVNGDSEILRQRIDRSGIPLSLELMRAICDLLRARPRERAQIKRKSIRVYFFCPKPTSVDMRAASLRPHRHIVLDLYHPRFSQVRTRYSICPQCGKIVQASASFHATNLF